MERTDHSGGGHDGARDQEDRVVSRRAGLGSTATEADERAHRAADPDTGDRPDTGSPAAGGLAAGGTAEQAGRDVATDDEGEPSRSE